MTTIWEILEGRKLDIEALAKKGWSVRQGREGGESLSIPFMRDHEPVGHKFRRWGGEHKWSAKWAATPIAYNEDCLRDDSLIDQPLIITEGEIDCESVLQAGFYRCISVPNGCGGAAEGRSEADLEASKAYDWLRQLEPLLHKDRVSEIVLATDGDKAGAKLMHELSVQLGRYRCKFVTYPKTRRADLGRERCKDMNEVLVEYGQAGVVETLNRREYVQMNGVRLLSQLPPLPDNVIYDIGFHGFSENYKMRLGDLCVVTGVPGFGKSSFLNDVCCRVALAYGVRIGWASFEQAPQRDHRRALRSWYTEKLPRHMTAQDTMAADKWIDDHHVFIVPDEEEDATLNWLFECMEAAVKRFNVKIMVIDPWNEVEHVREGRENETEYVSRAIRMLKRFAKAFQIHLILVAHPAKLQKANGKYLMPSLYDISGSANFYNKCDLGIIVHREDADSSIIKVAKSRYHETIGRPGEMKMSFCLDDRRFREIERLA